MSNSSFELTRFKLGCNALYKKSGAQTYFRFWHVHILWKSYERQVSSISDRYCKANNKHLKSYESSQELKHIIYLDANNLGGYAMSKFLPTSGFKWMDPKEIEKNGKLRKQNRSKPCKQQNRLFKIDIQTNYMWWNWSWLLEFILKIHLS